MYSMFLYMLDIIGHDKNIQHLTQEYPILDSDCNMSMMVGRFVCATIMKCRALQRTLILHLKTSSALEASLPFSTHTINLPNQHPYLLALSHSPYPAHTNKPSRPSKPSQLSSSSATTLGIPPQHHPPPPPLQPNNTSLQTP